MSEVSEQRKAALGKVWGERVDFHCPYDESTLRVDLINPGHICPCCWSHFDAPSNLGDRP